MQSQVIPPIDVLFLPLCNYSLALLFFFVQKPFQEHTQANDGLILSHLGRCDDSGLQQNDEECVTTNLVGG